MKNMQLMNINAKFKNIDLLIYLMENDKNFSRLRESFIRTLEDMARFRGIEPIFGRIFALIVLSPNPLTQEDITKETGYSRSQISRYLKSLEENSLINTRQMPGSRTLSYEGKAKSFLNNFKNYMENIGQFLNEKVVILDHILTESENLSEKQKESAETIRFKEVVSVYEAWFHTFLDVLNPFIEKFDKRLIELEKKILLEKI